MKKNHFLKPAPKLLKPSKFHKKSGGNRKFKGYIFLRSVFLLSLFLSLCFSCVFCFLFVFFAFFWGGVVLSCLYIYIYFFFLIFICFWISVEKQYVPPPPLQSATVFWDVSTNWPGSSHRVTARFSKKNLYNLPRCFAKITDFKKCKKKVYKVPPKMGTLYENVAGTL